MAKLLTGYQDMLGLLSVHKVARINTQVNLTFFALTTRFDAVLKFSGVHFSLLIVDKWVNELGF